MLLNAVERYAIEHGLDELSTSLNTSRRAFKETLDKSWFYCEGLANSVHVHHFTDA